MKILFAIKAMDNAAGGAERVLAIVASGLAALGHDVALLSFDKVVDGSVGDSFFPLDGRVRRIRLGLGDVTAKSGAAETLRRLPALRRAVLAESPDVAVGFMHSMFVPLSLALIGTGIPAIASEHIVPAHYRSRPVEYALLLACMPFVRTVTVTLPSVAGLYPRAVRRKIAVLPNPVAPFAAPDVEKRDVILNVGRLDPQKDQAVLIDAFAACATQYPSWRLRIVGEGKLRDDLMKQAKRLNIDERVELPGLVADMATEYAHARIFAMPSRYESFGLATAEAMAAGLPCVGFADCPGTNDLIMSGRNGLLTAGTDRALSLGRALESLILDADLRQRLGDAGRATAAAFAPDHIVKQWQGLLENTANKGTNAMDDTTDTMQAGGSCCHATQDPARQDSSFKTYRPLIVLALVALAMGIALSAGAYLDFMDAFMGAFLVLIATVKLFDLKGFVRLFERYDLAAMRSRRYALAYPFIELTLGLFYLSGTWPVLTNLLTLAIMTIGIMSVVRARRDGRDLACACMGAGFALPVGRVTIAEYGIMAAMAFLMLAGF